MAHPRKFRFAGGSAGRSASPAEWLDMARRLENWGYSAMSMGDHFFFPFAAIPALVAAAMVTSKLRFSTMLDNNVRYPSVVAKELATLDVMSGGRLEFGIGSGSRPEEHPRFLGLAPTPIAVRHQRLEEALQIIEGLWADGPFSFTGEHYKIDQLEGLPKPLQRPRPPLRIGGRRRNILTLAGRKADIVNPLLKIGELDRDGKRMSPEELLLTQLGWIKEAAGDRYGDLEIELLVWGLAVTNDRRAAAEAMVGPDVGRSAEEVLANPQCLIGTVDEIADRISECRERFGVSYYTIAGGAHRLAAFAPVVARLAGT